ncbi:MAG: PAS domain S-box protein [Burkholderiales bacterium]|nr:PAS domain S-box protein [Burkholderiales bacterium]
MIELPEATEQGGDAYRELCEFLPWGYLVLDQAARIEEVNSAAARLLGRPRADLVGASVLAYLADDCVATLLDTLARGTAGAGAREAPLELRGRDGRTRNVKAHVKSFTEGSVLRYRVTLLDVTRRKQAEEQASRYAQRLKGMSRRAVEVQEDERRALGHELHDRVGQNLAALNINLSIMKGALGPATAASVRSRLDDSLHLVERTIESMRGVMTELRPAVLDDYGLAAMLRWYAAEFGRRTRLIVAVVGRDPAPRLAPAVELTLFRIVQESLANVARHAGAQHVWVRLAPEADRFCLSVIDDGCGFDLAACEQADHPAWGLMIMRERAEAADGQLRVESAPGQGTRVVVEVAT